MIRIVDDDGTKTIDLVLTAQEKNAIFVCGNPYYWKEQATKYGISNVTIISYESYFKGYSWCWVGKNIIVDSLENFVSSQFNENLIGYGIPEE